MSLTRRWWVTVLALATLAGALSLLAGRALGYDPTSWQVWGDELAHATLHTAGGGPAWKPLPVFVDALFALFGRGVAVTAWLVVARGGAVVAVAAAFSLGRDTAGLAGAVGAAAATAVLVGAEFASLVSTGMSEPLCAALLLLAVLALHAGRHTTMLLAGFGAALLRPEAWPMLLAAAAWFCHTHRWRARPVGAAAATLALVPVAWFVPDLVTSGNLLRSLHRAQKPTSGGPLLTAHPVVALLQEAAIGLGRPLLIAAAVTVLLAALARARTPLVLAAIGAAWIGIDAALVQLHAASGDARYLLPGLCALAVVAGTAPARVVATLPGTRRRSIALGAAAALAAVALAAPGQWVAPARAVWRFEQVQTRADRQLGALLATPRVAAAARRVRVTTGPLQVPLVAWALRRPISAVASRPICGDALLLPDRRRFTPPWGYRAMARSGGTATGWTWWTPPHRSTVSGAPTPVRVSAAGRCRHPRPYRTAGR